MASKATTKRSKTTKNIEELKRKNLNATLQWTAIAVVFVLLILAVFAFGWGTGDGVIHSG